MAEPQLPKSVEKHQPKFELYSWKEYSVTELGNWVSLLMKRADHRVDSELAIKDLDAAQIYLDMIQAHLDAARTL